MVMIKRLYINSLLSKIIKFHIVGELERISVENFSKKYRAVIGIHFWHNGMMSMHAYWTREKGYSDHAKNSITSPKTPNINVNAVLFGKKM